eukprot:Hpha_TRINITY_DN16971_c1_g1::TRINITY_DN16971_c1_g1_i17::g.54735::m.54735
MEPAALLEEQLRTHAQQVAELQAAGEGMVEKVKIAFISDTHNCHRSFAREWGGGGFEGVDVLIHGGDATNEGTDAEFAEFNAWLGELHAECPKLRGRTYWVTGNHDMHTAVGRISGEISDRPLKGDRLTNEYFTRRVPNAILLDHGGQCEVAPGLWAAGVPWCPWPGFKVFCDGVFPGIGVLQFSSGKPRCSTCPLPVFSTASRRQAGDGVRPTHCVKLLHHEWYPPQFSTGTSTSRTVVLGAPPTAPGAPGPGCVILLAVLRAIK